MTFDKERYWALRNNRVAVFNKKGKKTGERAAPIRGQGLVQSIPPVLTPEEIERSHKEPTYRVSVGRDNIQTNRAMARKLERQEDHAMKMLDTHPSRNKPFTLHIPDQTNKSHLTMHKSRKFRQNASNRAKVSDIVEV